MNYVQRGTKMKTFITFQTHEDKCACIKMWALSTRLPGFRFQSILLNVLWCQWQLERKQLHLTGGSQRECHREHNT